jgi:hypothetical protein
MKPNLKEVPKPKAEEHTEDERKVLLDKLNWLCMGNADALSYCIMILDIVSTYDDVIDRDVEFNEQAVHSMMHNALFGLHYNKFYQANFNLLNGLMLNSVTNWRIANELERGNTLSDLHIAFIIRSSYADVLRMVAFIVGGDAHGLQAGIELRRYVHAEGMDSYLREQQGE